jgi:hypothetical protein
MPTDRYTKTVLTVIAASLVVLAIQNGTRNATAQQASLACSIMAPCYVKNDGITPLHVVEARTASTSTPPERYRGVPPNSGQLK